MPQFTRLFFGAALLSLVPAAAPVQAQLAPGVHLPAPDSAGWIRIFRGIQDTSNFYRYVGSSRVVPALNKQHFLGTNPASPSAPFTVLAGDTVRSAGSPGGHLIFRQTLSHFRVSFQMRWPGNVGNTGILVKVQENDTAQSQGFPRSVECQGDPTQGIGQIWALGSIREGASTVRNGGTWVTFNGTTLTHPSSWATTSFCSGQNGGQTPLAARNDSTLGAINYGGGGDPCNNLIVGRPGWQKPSPSSIWTGSAWRSNTDWVTVEVESHGRDTTYHYVDGQVVMKYWNPRIAPRAKADSVIKYLTSGLLAWQSEGSNVYFRNMKIKLFPEDPLYATLYPTALADRPMRAREFARPRIVLDRGFPVMVDRDGARYSPTGRSLPSLESSP